MLPGIFLQAKEQIFPLASKDKQCAVIHQTARKTAKPHTAYTDKIDELMNLLLCLNFLSWGTIFIANLVMQSSRGLNCATRNISALIKRRKENAA